MTLPDAHPLAALAVTFGDVGNGFFELVGALLNWKNVARIRRDRRVRGVWWPAWAFFAAWGWWNLWYYPSLGQWFSTGAGCVMVAANTAWVLLAIKYRRN